MRLKKLSKKFLAYACVGALSVSSLAGVQIYSANADTVNEGTEESTDVQLTNMTGTVGEAGKSWSYKFASLGEGLTNYKYLILTYQGNVKGLRFELSKVVDGDDVEKTPKLWVGPVEESEDNKQLTLVGEPDLDTTESSSVVIDLEASGIDMSKYNSAHMHITDIINIGTARLSDSPEVLDTDVKGELPEVEPEPDKPIDSSKFEPIILEGFIKEWKPEAEAEAEAGYAYLGAVELDAQAGYKFLKLTYTGDEKAFDDLRLEFEGDKTVGFVNPYDSQILTLEGTKVPAPTEEEQTVIIDLAASGLNVNNAIKKIHVHSTVENGSFTIKDAQLIGDIALEEKELSEFVKKWVPEEGKADGDYTYLGEVNVNARAGYKFLELTYKGDATAFDDLRLGFEGDKTVGFVNPYDAQIKTATKEVVPAPTEEEQTVVIDLAASGLDVTKAIKKIHVHSTAGNGTFEITAAKLLPNYEVPIDPSTLEDIILNGDENGASGMLGEKSLPEGTGYKYAGFVTLKDNTKAHKYLILTYSGDIGSLRFEFCHVDGEGKETEKTEPFWFNKEGQTQYFVAPDGSEIETKSETGKTIVIDLEKSGVELDKANSLYMHMGYGETKQAVKFTIGMARLSATPDVKDIDEMPTICPPDPGTDESTPAVETKPQQQVDSIPLTGDTTGKSSIVGSWTVKASTTTNPDGTIKENYKHLGYVTFNDLANAGFKYLKVTYTGDVSMLRFEFVANAGKANEELQGPFWFNPEQATHFVTKDGSAIPMIGNNTTVEIDLEKSGVDMSKYNSGFHMHYGAVETDMTLQILGGELYGGKKNEPQVTSEAPTTIAPTAAVIKKPGKTKVEVATKKKAAKKASIKLKKVKGAKGYQVKISTTRKFKAKKTRTILTKKVKFVIKKLKANKIYYVKARAYKGKGKAKVFGKWSGTKKVKFKK